MTEQQRITELEREIKFLERRGERWRKRVIEMEQIAADQLDTIRELRIERALLGMTQTVAPDGITTSSQLRCTCGESTACPVHSFGTSWTTCSSALN